MTTEATWDVSDMRGGMHMQVGPGHKMTIRKVRRTFKWDGTVVYDVSHSGTGISVLVRAPDDYTDEAIKQCVNELRNELTRVVALAEKCLVVISGV